MKRRKGNWKLLLLLCALAFVVSCTESVACSSIQETPEELLKDSSAVFRGTVIGAESIDPQFLSQEQAEEFNGILLIKVRWKIDEIFKGENLEGKSAITSTFCGVPIVVGAQYFFAIQPFTDAEPKAWDASVHNDIVGWLHFATVIGYSLQDEQYKFDDLSLAFKRLSQKN